MSKQNKGFTLVELLVVVLIIGILSAIALPQYQKAVGKARIAELKAVIPSYAKAIHLAYLETGKAFPSNDDLSIELPQLQNWDIAIDECITGNGKHGCSIWAQGKNAMNGFYIAFTEQLYYEADGHEGTDNWACGNNDNNALCKNLGFSKYDENADMYIEP